MFKNASKLAGLLLLLLLSFIYTDKVIDGARNSDPVMKNIKTYKEKNDVLAVEPIIKDDEIILGYSGLIVNEEESYKKMKEDDKFSEEKIVYEDALPKTTISKTYDYYIKQGNPSKKQVAILFKITSSKQVDELLKLVAKTGSNVSFFVDGSWLESNVETAFSMVNLGSELYNLGYDGKYDKATISNTNNLIESITLKDSSFCLNDEKNEEEKELCKKKKMHSILSTLNNPSINELKAGLVKGAIITYDLNSFDLDLFEIILNTIYSRGYEITSLSSVISEK